MTSQSKNLRTNPCAIPCSRRWCVSAVLFVCALVDTLCQAEKEKVEEQLSEFSKHTISHNDELKRARDRLRGLEEGLQEVCMCHCWIHCLTLACSGLTVCQRFPRACR